MRRSEAASSRLGAANVGTPLEQPRRQSRRQLRNRGRCLDRSRRARSPGVKTSRGERPVSVASAPSVSPIAWRARAMSATTAASSASRLAQVVLADDSRVEPVALQRDGVDPRLARVLEHDEERIGGAQAEVRVGDVGGDGDADRLAVVARRDEIVRRRRARRCDTCPTRRARTTCRRRCCSRCSGRAEGSRPLNAVLCDSREREAPARTLTLG